MTSFERCFFVLALLPVLCGCTGNSWKPFTNQEGNFKVSFPGKYTYKEQVKPSMYGQLDVKMYYGEETGGNPVNDVYMVLYTDFNDSDLNSGMSAPVIDLFFSSAIDEAIANAKARLLQKEETRLGKYPGRRIRFAFGEDGHLMYMKLFLVGHREYVLGVACSKKNEDNPKIARFFESFELLNSH
jgi:hypothetical protein